MISILKFSNLDQPTLDKQTQEALEKLERRVKLFRADRPWPDLENQAVISVDDGIAAGSTLRVALMAIHNTGARKIIAAIPTAHQESLVYITDRADALYCANTRSGPQFAVAAAYQQWNDVDETDASRMLKSFRNR